MKVIIHFTIGIILLSACRTNTSYDKENSNNNIVQEKRTLICITAGTSVYEEANQSSRLIASLSLGETLYNVKNSLDNSDRSSSGYLNVELSDGQVAWVNSKSVVIDAEPAAILTQTKVFNRPDIATLTDAKYSPLEFVTILREKDDWVEVVGVNKLKQGWIKKETVTTKAEDIATSLFAYGKLLHEGELIVENITVFLEELPYEDTQFISYLQSVLDDEVGAAVEDIIEAYEKAEGEIFE